MREAIKQMKPNKFDDIIALVALYRPGPRATYQYTMTVKMVLKSLNIFILAVKTY